MSKVSTLKSVVADKQAQEGSEADQSLLGATKHPRRSGIGGVVKREVKRTADHRGERRFTDVTDQEAVPVLVNGLAGELVNVSKSGLKVKFSAPLKATIGDELRVEFATFPAYTGRLVWMRGTEAGIELPSSYPA